MTTEAQKRLHIAWLGPVPDQSNGVQGVASNDLDGFARPGHRIDCFFPDSPAILPARLERNPSLEFLWSGGRGRGADGPGDGGRALLRCVPLSLAWATDPSR